MYQNAPISKKKIDTITTSNLYLKFKESNENDMAAQVFWAVFYSSWQLSQIGSTTDFNGAAILPPIFSMERLKPLSVLFFKLTLDLEADKQPYLH